MSLLFEKSSEAEVELAYRLIRLVQSSDDIYIYWIYYYNSLSG